MKGLSWIICVNSKCNYECCFKMEAEEDVTETEKDKAM